MPFESQAQRGLAHAVASGKAKGAGMSKSAAKKMIADDPGGKLPKRIGKKLAAAVTTSKNNMDMG